MYAIVITKPGHDTLRYGPMLPTMADQWMQYLNWARRSVAMPNGTTWEKVPYDKTQPHTDPYTIPTSTDALTIALMNDTYQGAPEAFPDLFLLLQCMIGGTEAHVRWMAACRDADHCSSADLD